MSPATHGFPGRREPLLDWPSTGVESRVEITRTASETLPFGSSPGAVACCSDGYSGTLRVPPFLFKRPLSKEMAKMLNKTAKGAGPARAHKKVKKSLLARPGPTGATCGQPSPRIALQTAHFRSAISQSYIRRARSFSRREIYP